MAIERIIIVDENDANVLFFEVVLKDLGYKNVKHGRGGNDAMAIMKEQHPQFVIVAWEMAAMAGTIFVQKAREELRKPHLPYLIYSKRIGEQDLKLVRELGFANVLTMPLDKEKAKAEITRIISLENGLSKEEIKLRKIESMLAEGKPTEALKLVDGTMRKKGPFFVRSQVAVGQIWLQIGQLPKAEEALKLALEEDNTNVDALNAMATVHSKSGRHQEAIKTLEQMSANSPKNMNILLNLGSAFVDADRHDDAKAVFGKVSALDPDQPRVKDEMAKVAFKEGDMPLAAKLLAETKNGDSMARYFNNLAIAMTHKNDYDKAIDTYEKAIQLLGNAAKLSALRYNLGLALAKKGDLQRSFNELVVSYKGDPQFEKAYAALVRVSKQMLDRGLKYDQQLVREVNALRKTQKPTNAA